MPDVEQKPRRRPRKRKRNYLIRELRRRYKHICQSCGCKTVLTHEAPNQATIDHIVPLSCGGSNHMDNLQLLCRTCNQNKGSDVEFEAS